MYIYVHIYAYVCDISGKNLAQCRRHKRKYLIPCWEDSLRRKMKPTRILAGESPLIRSLACYSLQGWVRHKLADLAGTCELYLWDKFPVVSKSSWISGLYHARLFCPWDSLGARILEAMPFTVSSPTQDQTCIAGKKIISLWSYLYMYIYLYQSM